MHGIRIDPDTYYPEHELRVMGIDADALEKAVSARELRVKSVGDTPMYKGAWLIAWLDREQEAATP